jgi:hypothetical protein
VISTVIKKSKIPTSQISNVCYSGGGANIPHFQEFIFGKKNENFWFSRKKYEVFLLMFFFVKKRLVPFISS